MFTLRLLGEAKMTGRLVYLLMPIHSFCPAGFIAPHCVMFLNVYAMLCEGGSGDDSWPVAEWFSLSHILRVQSQLSFFFFFLNLVGCSRFCKF